jgi:hypothetical protein
MKTFATCLLSLFVLAPVAAEAQQKTRDTEIPYQQRFVLQFAAGDSFQVMVTDPDESVPPNMELTVRNVNYLYNLKSGQSARCYIARFIDPLFSLTAKTEWLNLPGNGTRIGSGNFQSGFVLDEGDFEIVCTRNDTSGSANIRVTLTGALTRER